MKTLARIFDGMVELLSSLFLIIMFATVTFSVYSRYMISKPTFWTDELARYCMFFMVMTGSAAALRKNTHPALTFVTEGLKGAGRIVLRYWVVLLVFATVALLFWAGWEFMMDARRAKTAALRIYYSRVYFAIPMGCVLMGIVLLRKLHTTVRGGDPLGMSESEAEEGEDK